MSATATAKGNEVEQKPIVLASRPTAKNLMDEVQPKVSIPDVEPQKPYRVGMKPGAPKQDIALAGICFPLYTEVVTGSGAQTIRSRRDGDVVRLSDRQVEQIKKAAARKVFRMEGARRIILDASDKNYAPLHTDESVARYVYMVPMVEEPDMMAVIRGEK